MFLGTFVLLNLIVAVILENFSALGDVNPDLVSAADIADFGDMWCVQRARPPYNCLAFEKCFLQCSATASAPLPLLEPRYHTAVSPDVCLDLPAQGTSVDGQSCQREAAQGCAAARSYRQ